MREVKDSAGLDKIQGIAGQTGDGGVDVKKARELRIAERLRKGERESPLAQEIEISEGEQGGWGLQTRAQV